MRILLQNKYEKTFQIFCKKTFAARKIQMYKILHKKIAKICSTWGHRGARHRCCRRRARPPLLPLGSAPPPSRSLPTAAPLGERAASATTGKLVDHRRRGAFSLLVAHRRRGGLPLVVVCLRAPAPLRAQARVFGKEKEGEHGSGSEENEREEGRAGGITM